MVINALWAAGQRGLAVRLFKQQVGPAVRHRLEPRVLDLHGLSGAAALACLEVEAEGKRSIDVVTGRGIHSEGADPHVRWSEGRRLGTPVLRETLIAMLEEEGIPYESPTPGRMRIHFGQRTAAQGVERESKGAVQDPAVGLKPPLGRRPPPPPPPKDVDIDRCTRRG